MTNYPKHLRSLFQTPEDRIEELQYELDRIQDEIVRLDARKRFDEMDVNNAPIH